MGNGLKPPDKGDWSAALVRLGLFTILIVVSGLLLLGMDVPIGWFIWIAVTVLSVWWLVTWHTRSFGYQCPKCGHGFTISRRTNLLSPNILGKSGPSKYLRCPNCHQRSWCPVQVLIEQP